MSLLLLVPVVLACAFVLPFAMARLEQESKPVPTHRAKRRERGG